MVNTSFWERDSFLQAYDLAVIGAGIVGLSAALFYKQKHPHKRVAVFERGFLPQGASTRNAGFACVGSIGEHLADIKKDTEESVKKRIVRRYQGLELLKNTLGEKAMDYEHCGGYEFFRSTEAFQKVAPEIDRFNRWMNDLVGEQQVYSADEIQGYPVIRNRLEGAIHPGKMMQQLAERVSETGVEIKWGSEVQKVAEDGVLHLSNDVVFKADKVLFAANGFVRRLVPDLDVSPARGYVLVTNEQANLPWKDIFHHDRGYIYFRNVGNRLLIGGARNIDKKTEETDRFGTNEQIKTHLKNFVSNTLRLGNRWEIDYEWSGIMGFTSTKTPLIEQIDSHRYIAAGLSGMGIAIGMEVGRTAAEILER